MRTISRHRALFAAALLGAGLALATTACSSGSGTSAFVGTWGEEGEGLPSLTLTEDKTLTGTDGCNRLVGSFSVDGETIGFEQVASTKMACSDVDTWLSSLATGRVVDGSLEVSDASGAVIGSLAKQ